MPLRRFIQPIFLESASVHYSPIPIFLSHILVHALFILWRLHKPMLISIYKSFYYCCRCLILLGYFEIFTWEANFQYMLGVRGGVPIKLCSGLKTRCELWARGPVFKPPTYGSLPKWKLSSTNIFVDPNSRLQIWMGIGVYSLFNLVYFPEHTRVCNLLSALRLESCYPATCNSYLYVNRNKYHENFSSVPQIFFFPITQISKYVSGNIRLSWKS